MAVLFPARLELTLVTISQSVNLIAMRSLILLIALGAFALPASAQTWKISTAYSLDYPVNRESEYRMADQLAGSLLSTRCRNKALVLLGAELGWDCMPASELIRPSVRQQYHFGCAGQLYQQQLPSLGSRFNLWVTAESYHSYLSPKVPL